MINLSNITAGLVLGLVITSATVPAFAAGQRGHQAGRDARAQAIEENIGARAMPAGREDALRYCNEKTSGMRDYSGANLKLWAYRTCMNEHGQPE
jgi:hypothetical protein